MFYRQASHLAGPGCNPALTLQQPWLAPGTLWPRAKPWQKMNCANTFKLSSLNPSHGATQGRRFRAQAITMHDLVMFGPGCLKIAPCSAALAPTAPFWKNENKLLIILQPERDTRPVGSSAIRRQTEGKSVWGALWTRRDLRDNETSEEQREPSPTGH